MASALVREIPDSFVRALVRHGTPAIDVPLARRQHREYQHRLEEAGYDIIRLTANEDYPDCVFVEDAAVIVGTIAVITRPGAPSRRGETAAVADALGVWLPLTEIKPPGTLDGGDVFILGDMVFAGRSERTNADGIAQLAAIAATQGLGLTAVGVYDTLHLKSAVLPLDPETVLVAPQAVDEEQLAGLRIVYQPIEERLASSALPLRDGRLLVTAASPRTAALLADMGHRAVEIDVSQIQAADGGLTCMSILF
jgi:dimethylargininase